ncbi:hypothetical protein Afil01_65500 [Actinorhabdospora filicis]|uniref:ABC3 transporter permease C-terminal domain-containing protein n=1 Tax=Actinorhabdospora filicis TaxID=1785913 RepID=A0A9W6WD47_9ACTN|nr:FtsX-like permease family protein [Actinorhabdospora filicis]GLZ81743.1 hypothetical protein Afil01_65500 [Actinorhabdospora filicis]
MSNVTFRGIRHRAGRSAVVFTLAIVAVAAAVLAPAYTAAAQQSMLTDEMRAMSTPTATVTLYTVGDETGEAYRDPAEFRAAITAELAKRPKIAEMLGDPVGYTDFNNSGRAAITGGSENAQVLVSSRDAVCAHLTFTSGHCPTGPGEVTMSARSAKALGFVLGQSVTVVNGQPGHPYQGSLTLVGLHEATDLKDPYWGPNPYFSFGRDEQDKMISDAVFVAGPEVVRAFGGPKIPITTGLEYPVLREVPRLADVETIQDALADLKTALLAEGRNIDTVLPGVFGGVRADNDAVAAAVPVVSIPLILLCWFVLFLVVANLTAGRGPEIALAKLRGYQRGGTVRFGLGEPLWLIALAAPFGFLLGLGLVEGTASLVLAGGTHVRIDADVFVYALTAIAGAAVAATIGAWRTLSLGVPDLLRRVPPRKGWRVGIVDGVLAAVAAIAVYQAVEAKPGESRTLVLLAPPMLALLVGIATARLLAIFAKGRVGAAGTRGRATAMLTWTQIARRPAMRQLVVLVTVAVSLLSFAAIAWQMGEHNRELAAEDALGADTVYTVTTKDPVALINAVTSVDPQGTYAMAAARALSRYNDATFSVIGVQSDRLAAVGRWRDHDRAALEDVARQLRPGLPDPVRLNGSLTIEATASGLSSQRPIKLVATVLTDGDRTITARLGDLVEGRNTFTSTVCPGPCRLVGLGLSRFPGSSDEISATVTVSGMASGDTDLSATLGDPANWRRLAGLGDSGFLVSADGTGLRMQARSVETRDLIAEHASIPADLPAVIAGEAPADDKAAADFAYPGLNGVPQPFHVTGSARILPQGGTRGLFTDLGLLTTQATTLGSVSNLSTVVYQVWATADAPADLPQRLAAAGIDVTGTDSMTAYLDRVGRRAPALSLRLYLLAGGAAVLLAVGSVLFTAQAASAARGYEVAALRVAGVPRKVLRRSVAYEYVIVVGVPLLLGVASGAVASKLMIPLIPLVSAEGDSLPPDLVWTGPWPPAAVAVTLFGFAAAVGVAVRTLRRVGRASRLREGEQ